MKMNLKPAHKKILGSLLAVNLILLTGFFVHKTESASLTSVSVTLSNPRPSFRGALAGTNTLGSTVVTIDTDPGDYPSTSSAQLVEGDTVLIGEAGSLGTYTVAGSTPHDTLEITTGLASGDIENGDDVVATESATLAVRFTTANALANGRFRVLVPALTDDGASSDGIPDGGFWDFGSSAPTVTCPNDVGSTFDFVAGTATASAITISGTDYHSFECAYSGAGGAGEAFNGTNDEINIDSLINPAPETGHTTGTADTYGIIVQHLNSGLAIQDRSTSSVGIIEAVKISATVAPQITFRIIGVASSTGVCGITTDVTTTPYEVPFGELSISSFTHAAQALTVSTNATNGYSVTAVANDQLGLDGGTCTGDNTGSSCIPDSVGDNSAMSHTASDEWVTASVKGLGYTLHDTNTSGLTPAFEYDTATGNCSGTYCARQFADAEDSQSAVEIFSHTDVADNQNLHVCYKSIISSIQSAGYYENYVTYTATATF